MAQFIMQAATLILMGIILIYQRRTMLSQKNQRENLKAAQEGIEDAQIMIEKQLDRAIEIANRLPDPENGDGLRDIHLN